MHLQLINQKAANTESKGRRTPARGPQFPSRLFPAGPESNGSLIASPTQGLTGSKNAEYEEQAFVIVGSSGKIYQFHRLPSSVVSGAQAGDMNGHIKPEDQQSLQQHAQNQLPHTPPLFKILEADLFATCLSPASGVSSTPTANEGNASASLPRSSKRSYVRANIIPPRYVTMASIGAVVDSNTILIATRSHRQPYLKPRPISTATPERAGSIAGTAMTPATLFNHMATPTPHVGGTTPLASDSLMAASPNAAATAAIADSLAVLNGGASAFGTSPRAGGVQGGSGMTPKAAGSTTLLGTSPVAAVSAGTGVSPDAVAAGAAMSASLLSTRSPAVFTPGAAAPAVSAEPANSIGMQSYDSWQDAILISEVTIDWSPKHSDGGDCLTTRLVEPIWPHAAASRTDEPSDLHPSRTTLHDFSFIEVKPSITPGSSEAPPNVSPGLKLAASLRSSSQDGKGSRLRAWDIKSARPSQLLSKAFDQFKSKSLATAQGKDDLQWAFSLSLDAVVQETMVDFVDSDNGCFVRDDYLLITRASAESGGTECKIKTWDPNSGQITTVLQPTVNSRSIVALSPDGGKELVALDFGGRPLRQSVNPSAETTRIESMLERVQDAQNGSATLARLVREAATAARDPIPKLFLESLAALRLFEKSKEATRAQKKQDGIQEVYCAEHVWLLLATAEWATETIQGVCRSAVVHCSSLPPPSTPPRDSVSDFLAHENPVGRQIWMRILQHVDAVYEWLDSSDAPMQVASAHRLDLGQVAHSQPPEMEDEIQVAKEITKLRRVKSGINASNIARILKDHGGRTGEDPSAALWLVEEIQIVPRITALFERLAEDDTQCVTEPLALLLTADLDWRLAASSKFQVRRDVLTKAKIGIDVPQMHCIRCAAVSSRNSTAPKCLCGSGWWAV